MQHGQQDPEHYSAAICRRGHVVTRHMELLQGPPPPHCEECGARVFMACPNCESQIPGPSRGGFNVRYDAPPFCPYCAHPYPWASREAIVHHIENQLEEEPDLSEGERRTLIAQLDTLRDDPRGEQEKEEKQAKVLERLRAAAPKAFKAAMPSIMDLSTAYIKARLKLQ
jgi:hypothetical protein